MSKHGRVPAMDVVSLGRWHQRYLVVHAEILAYHTHQHKLYSLDLANLVTTSLYRLRQHDVDCIQMNTHGPVS